MPDGLLATSERRNDLFVHRPGVLREVRKSDLRRESQPPTMPRLVRRRRRVSAPYITSISILEASDFFSFARISASNFFGSIPAGM